jgi:hypothetical protein
MGYAHRSLSGDRPGSQHLQHRRKGGSHAATGLHFDNLFYVPLIQEQAPSQDKPTDAKLQEKKVIAAVMLLSAAGILVRNIACILSMLPIHFSPARPCKWQGRAARHCFWFVSCVSACIEIQEVHVRRASYRSNFVPKGLHARCLFLKRVLAPWSLSTACWTAYCEQTLAATKPVGATTKTSRAWSKQLAAILNTHSQAHKT